MTDLVPVRRALLSLSDKSGLQPLATALVAAGVELVSTGGTAKTLRDMGHAVRFHLAPGVEPTITADGMGAILRSPGAPPWNFRCRGAMLTTEESIHIDGQGTMRGSMQIVIVGEISGLGGEIAWQLRRSS